MDFYFKYTLTYKTGEYFISKTKAVVELTTEQYRRLALALRKDPMLEAPEEVADIVALMKEKVRFIDSYTNKDGTMRKTALKTPREIKKITVVPCSEELTKIMKYPLEMIDQPEETITICGSAEDNITITTRYGEVRVTTGHITTIFDADEFIRLVRR